MLCRIDGTTAILESKKGIYKLTIYEGDVLLCEDAKVDTENDSLAMALEFILDEHKDKISAGIDEIIAHLLSPTDINIGEVLARVTKVVDYGMPGGMDIFFDEDSFRVDEDTYMNPKPFQLWYFSKFNRPLNVTLPDYMSFISTLKENAVKSMYDPIYGSFLDVLIDTIVSTPVFVTAGMELYEAYKTSPSDLHLLYDNKTKVLYVNKQGLSSLAELHKVPLKKVKEYIQPYLKPKKDDRKWIGDRKKPFESVNLPVWMFDIIKLANYDSRMMPANLLLTDGTARIVTLKGTKVVVHDKEE